MIPFFYHFEGKAREKMKCSTFVEQCLKLFSFSFKCLFVFSQGKINFVVFNFRQAEQRGQNLASCSRFLLIKRKSSCVFKLNKTYAPGRKKCFQVHLTNDSSQILPRKGLVILIKLYLCTFRRYSKEISLSFQMNVSSN